MYITNEKLNELMSKNSLVNNIWSGLSEQEKVNLNETATQQIDLQDYKGQQIEKYSAFPRIFDPNKWDEYDLVNYSYLIPHCVIKAVILYVQIELQKRQESVVDLKDFQNTNVKEIKAGSVEVVFEPQQQKTLPKEVYYLISEFLKDQGIGRLER